MRFYVTYVDKSHTMKSIHVYLTAGYLASTKTNRRLQGDTCYKALLLGWMDRKWGFIENQHGKYFLHLSHGNVTSQGSDMFCGSDTSCGVFANTTSRGNTMCGKKDSMKEISKLQAKYGVVPRL